MYLILMWRLIERTAILENAAPTWQQIKVHFFGQVGRGLKSVLKSRVQFKGLPGR